MKLLLGCILLAVLISGAWGIYPAPPVFPDLQMPEIVMPEMHSLNISADIVFPELQPVELVIDFPFDEEEASSLGLNQTEETELDSDSFTGTGMVIEFGEGWTNVPEPGVEAEIETLLSQYDVIICQQNGFILAENANESIALAPIESDVASLFKAAVDATPDGGSLHIAKGHYILSAPYAFPLNPDGSNIFYSSMPVLDKDMHISGDGVDETIIQLAPGQRSPSRHVAMVLIRATKAYDLGYDEFSVSDLTLDGNRAEQIDGQPHDGEALILSGSLRTNGNYHDLKLINSHGSGVYSGNNGAGPESDAVFHHIFAQNCGAEGIILDTCHNCQVTDCEAWQCRECVVLYGNDDWQTRSLDQVSASGIKTDSQVTVWQVNDFVLSDINMDCSQTTGSYGLMIRDGTGLVENSILKSSQTREDSTGGATYIQEGSDVRFVNCRIEGYYGIHTIGSRARVETTDCEIDAVM